MGLFSTRQGFFPSSSSSSTFSSSSSSLCCQKICGLHLTRHLLRVYISTFLVQFSSTFSFAMIFPYLPFLVQFLLPHVDEADLGKYAGVIISSMFLGRFFGSYVWGLVADIKGRRPVIIASCLGLGLSSAAFGFSVNLPMAVLFQFAIGANNGIVGTTKGIISESSNDINQSFGIAILAASSSLGFVAGPAIAGTTADPIGQYNLTISDPFLHGLLTKFPYCLPSLINFLLCVVVAISVGFLLPETLQKKKSKNVSQSEHISSGSTNNSSIDDKQELVASETSQTGLETSQAGPNSRETLSTCSSKENLRVKFSKHRQIPPNALHNTIEHRKFSSETKPVSVKEHRNLNKKEMEEDLSITIVGASNNDNVMMPFVKPSLSALHRKQNMEEERVRRKEEGLAQEEVEMEEEEEVGEEGVGREREEERGRFFRLLEKVKISLMKALVNLKHFLCSKVTGLSLLIYCIYSTSFIDFEEIFSLWAAADTELGGLGWSLHEISIALTVSAAIFFPFTFLFPVMERKIGLINTYYLNATMVMVCMILMPNLHVITAPNLKLVHTTLVILVLALLNVSAENTFCASFLFINNSVPFSQLGSVNGLAVSLTSLTRTISPVFSGSIFSVSLSNGTREFGFPANHYLVFVIFGLVVFSSISMAAFLPESINRQKVEEKEEEEQEKEEEKEEKEKQEQEDEEQEQEKQEEEEEQEQEKKVVENTEMEVRV